MEQTFAATVKNDDSDNPLSASFWKDKSNMFPDIDVRSGDEQLAGNEPRVQPQTEQDIKTHGIRMHHEPTGRDIIIHTERTVKLTPEELKRFAERGRMLMLNAETQEPITEYQGIPLPTDLQEIIKKRSAYLDEKYDEAAPSSSSSSSSMPFGIQATAKRTSVTTSSTAASSSKPCKEEDMSQACACDDECTDEDEEDEEDEEDGYEEDEEEENEEDEG